MRRRWPRAIVTNTMLPKVATNTSHQPSLALPNAISVTPTRRAAIKYRGEGERALTLVHTVRLEVPVKECFRPRVRIKGMDIPCNFPARTDRFRVVDYWPIGPFADGQVSTDAYPL